MEGRQRECVCRDEREMKIGRCMLNAAVLGASHALPNGALRKHVKPPVMRCNEENDLHSPAMIRAANMTYMDFLSQHCRLIARKRSYCKSLGKHVQCTIRIIALSPTRMYANII